MGRFFSFSLNRFFLIINSYIPCCENSTNNILCTHQSLNPPVSPLQLTVLVMLNILLLYNKGAPFPYTHRGTIDCGTCLLIPLYMVIHRVEHYLKCSLPAVYCCLTDIFHMEYSQCLPSMTRGYLPLFRSLSR